MVIALKIIKLAHGRSITPMGRQKLRVFIVTAKKVAYGKNITITDS
ncbi:hypothetical protein FEDK69T_02420 [Flavobacterium enshiense DK69]|nr:hypothetical protein FEDK69T_02420 [Flavobacterium enshiense DK69]